MLEDRSYSAINLTHTHVTYVEGLSGQTSPCPVTRLRPPWQLRLKRPNGATIGRGIRNVQCTTVKVWQGLNESLLLVSWFFNISFVVTGGPDDHAGLPSPPFRSPPPPPINYTLVFRQVRFFFFFFL